ncbi:MAG: hypothetical protein KAH54_10540 [Candidatus Sabulitectum sp.]|nr:hypothetical protein [Candidatus Sabulitectum sp.]
MKFVPTILFLLAGLIILISCESSSEGSVQRTDDIIVEYDLAVIDSFGVEIGDSLNMIASIDGCFTNSDGSIVLLDATARKIRIIEENGEVFCFGRAGQGPGELTHPKNMCLMPDGRILVSDDHKCLVMEFDISGNHLGSYLESEWKVPEHCLPIDSNSVVGAVFDVVFSEGEIEGLNYYVGRFDSSPDPSVRYDEICYEFTDPGMYTQIDILDFCVDPNGLVYIVPDHTDYLINVLSSDGTAQGQICPEVVRLEKTNEEMAAELAEFEESHVWDRGYTGGYEPIPYYRLISLVGVDADRNLWVRRMDVEGIYSFDLWDLSGNLVQTASAEKFTSNPDLEFHVDENGILGIITNSDVHPRVYRLEMHK